MKFIQWVKDRISEKKKSKNIGGDLINYPEDKAVKLSSKYKKIHNGMVNDRMDRFNKAIRSGKFDRK